MKRNRKMLRTMAAIWERGCARIPSIRITSRVRSPCRGHPPAARPHVDQHRQPDGTRRGRDGVWQLLHDARSGRPCVHLAGGRPGISGTPVVVLAYDYWVNRFPRNPGFVGRKILVNNSTLTIVGVSAQGFAGLDPTQSPELLVPIQVKPVLCPGLYLRTLASDGQTFGPSAFGDRPCATPSNPPLGSASNIPIFGCIGTAVYRIMMADADIVGPTPETLRMARDTLGGATAVAERLANQVGAELVGAAREAFVHGSR
jgi:hypothetical protein